MEDKKYLIDCEAFVLYFNQTFFAESDLFIGLLTFMACLILPLEIGLLLGVAVNMISILHSAARPKVTVEPLKVS